MTRATSASTAAGPLSVAKVLDYETAESYSLTVRAEDPDGLSDTATVAITVTDVNEAPAFDEEEYTFTVAEDASVGAPWAVFRSQTRTRTR